MTTAPATAHTPETPTAPAKAETREERMQRAREEWNADCRDRQRKEWDEQDARNASRLKESNIRIAEARIDKQRRIKAAAEKYHCIDPSRPYSGLPLTPMENQGELVCDIAKEAGIEIVTKKERAAIVEKDQKFNAVHKMMLDNTMNAAKLRYEKQFLPAGSDDGAISKFASAEIHGIDYFRAQAAERLRGLNKQAKDITTEAVALISPILKRFSDAAEKVAKRLDKLERDEAKRFNLPFSPSPRLIATWQLSWRIRPGKDGFDVLSASAPKSLLKGLFELE